MIAFQENATGYVEAAPQTAASTGEPDGTPTLKPSSVSQRTYHSGECAQVATVSRAEL